MKHPSLKILLSTLETGLILLPFGPLLFYPFLSQYGFWDVGSYVEWGLILSGIASLASCLLVFLPAGLIFLKKAKIPGTKELASLLSLVLILGVLGLTILHKGLEPAGEAGKPLLFALVLFSILASWVFAMRFESRFSNQSSEVAP